MSKFKATIEDGIMQADHRPFFSEVSKLPEAHVRTFLYALVQCPSRNVLQDAAIVALSADHSLSHVSVEGEFQHWSCADTTRGYCLWWDIKGIHISLTKIIPNKEERITLFSTDQLLHIMQLVVRN